jgi:uncharacterized protein (TIGR03086 family)
MDAMSVREFFPAAADEVLTIVKGVDPEDLGRPTPCTDFDLRRLVNHFIGTTGALARVGGRQPLDPDDPYGSRRDPSQGDWQRELATNIESLAQAWAQPQAWDGTVEMGGPAMPAPMIGEMALAEVLLHGWDLARATGQQLSVPDEVGRELRRSIEETAELGRSMGAYSDEVSVGDHASQFERALATSGRDPGWHSE